MIRFSTPIVTAPASMATVFSASGAMIVRML
jgi:hypothetical protein